MPFDIDSFSRFLCFMIPNKIALPFEIDSESFQIGVNPENLSFVIDKLHNMYELRFLSVIELTRESKTHTETPFMQKVIARCVNISEKAKSFGHFLLVCTLIKGIAEDHLDSVHCFFYPSLCYYCLISVYNRCYKEFFDSKEGTDETFDSFVTNLRQLLSMQNSLEDMRNLPVFSEMNIATVLEDLIHVEYRDFPLTEYEQESLEDLPDLLKPSTWNPPAYKSSESLSESSSCRGIATDDATECDSMDEDSTSKPSEVESVRSGINMDVIPPESSASDCSDMTSFSSDSKSSSSCRDSTINIGVPKSVSMESDTSKSSELKSTSSTDATTSSMERDDVSMRADWEYYKERICDFCRSRCAVLPVNYITKILERQITEGENE